MKKRINTSGTTKDAKFPILEFNVSYAIIMPVNSVFTEQFQ